MVGLENPTTVLVAGTTVWTSPLASRLEATLDVTVQQVRTGPEAVDALRTGSPTCLVTAYALDGYDGIDVIDRIRQEDQSTPLLLCTADGSEEVANSALAAGATDYVPVRGEEVESVVDRIHRAVRTAQRSATHRERAWQFESIFQNSAYATWVLDSAGRVQRANQTARSLTGERIESLVGKPFWESRCWTGSEGKSREDIREFVETTRDTQTTRQTTTETELSESVIVDLSAHPVHSETQKLQAIVVTGVDVTERVSLQRELRASEELHRVTLNNMTDTVLVTDEAGEFTYICPNVAFIFGYSVAEIREFGTIDELLGEDLFDRAELADAGVLKNIECTATDRAGTEHTLLVNVREVDIQGGTLLFSCRDITKRKQRENALTTLHQTTRQLLYAETKQEIAHRLVADTDDILAVDASAMYLYQTDENRLQPVAYTNRMQKYGPLQSVRTDDANVLGQCFLENEARFFDDGNESAQPGSWQTALPSSALIPLGNHGVFVAGSRHPGAFDEMKREIADLVAATAEAALDRVARENQLREQDETLQRQNQQLAQVNEINELIREIDRTLVQAETREEVFQSVCNVLTRQRNFTFAWIGTPETGTDRLTCRGWAGDDTEYLDQIRRHDDHRDEATCEPSARTAANGEVTVVSNVAETIREGRWQTHALRRGYQSVISIPLVYDGFHYGVLSVYADRPGVFDGRPEDVLVELGETIGLALSALDRKNALLTNTSTQLEFETQNTSYLPLQLAQHVGCSMSFQPGIHKQTDVVVMFVTVETDAVAKTCTQAEQMTAIENVQVLTEGETNSLLQLQLSWQSLAPSLADYGAVLDRIDADPAAATLFVDVPQSLDAGPIIQHVTERLDGSELRAKRTGTRTPVHEFYSTVLERLTPRQLEVVQTAYYGGYFESPRDQTGEDIAAVLDISPPAFYQHTRAVQRKLFSTLFDDVGLGAHHAEEERVQ